MMKLRYYVAAFMKMNASNIALPSLPLEMFNCRWSLELIKLTLLRFDSQLSGHDSQKQSDSL